jgi:hypothetical protein
MLGGANNGAVMPVFMTIFRPFDIVFRPEVATAGPVNYSTTTSVPDISL